MKLIPTLIFLFATISSCLSEEWVRFMDPSSVRIIMSQTRGVVEIETWKLRGYKNFVNLSFWDNTGPVGRLYIDSISHGRRKKDWPVFSIDPIVGEYASGIIRNGFSGSGLLVKDSKPVRQKRTFFARRKCPRTGVGLTHDGKIVVIVTTSATLKQFAKRFVDNGAVFAINVDGGSSTMFIENGVSLWKSKRSAVPVILTW